MLKNITGGILGSAFTPYLPPPLRAAILSALFGVATLMIYGLLTSFPLEVHIAFATVAIGAVALKLLYFEVGRRARRSRRSVEAVLEAELERLKAESGLDCELKVRWIPNPGYGRHGEVKGKTIFIYDESFDRALTTLKHEFIEYHINKELLEPLVKLINVQKCIIEDLIYSRKERLVKGLIKLL